ncbi:hypothetical protein C8F04DRAFT_1178979 [Mycena alexandri]|uniref:DUF6535 domain-containing protein n=1 Tax=Mycena alexandri TaxID=1745969 RepID=A0AAD6T8U5_9AGAR|nr:hypothetical protein C8F04DRAFT_1178979 [Mycena alexandri]
MDDLEKQTANFLGTEEACAKMWSVYVSQAEKYDKALVAGWRADMKGILIFNPNRIDARIETRLADSVEFPESPSPPRIGLRFQLPFPVLTATTQAGLFSGTLTAFIIESYRALTPNTTDLLLAQISRQLNNVPAVISDSEFTPTTSALICNGLWFTSLGLSLASAVIATLVEQWSRDYLNKSDMRPSPIERARICSYLYSGLKRFRMHAIVDLIPLLLHMSLLLFLAGLVAFLLPVNWIMTLVAASLLGVVGAVYAALTVMPLLFANSPCRTPLSGVLWRIGQICMAPSSFLGRGVSQRMEEVMMHRATAESGRRSTRDRRALCWTLKSLTTEQQLDPFVEAIPQVIWSWTPLTRRREHDHLLQTLIDDAGVQLGPRIAALLLTCENGLLEPKLRQQRTVLCLKALLAFALAAEVRPPPSPKDEDRPLVFPFELSTIGYFSTTTYPPAQPYIPALRACVMWSLCCSFLASVEDLIALYDKDNAKESSRTKLFLELRNAVHLEQKYISAGGSPFSQDRSMLSTTLFPQAHALTGHQRQTLHRLLDSTPCCKLDIFSKFLVDAVVSESEPYGFAEAIKTLRPDRILVTSDPSALRECLKTLRAIVHRTKNEATGINHVDRALSVYLPLFDAPFNPEAENYIGDALITYLNGKHHLGAVLHVLRQCEVDRVRLRVTRRLTRADRPDDVLTAVWRLCELILHPRFDDTDLKSMSLRALVETASALPPVSQYSTSVAAMLRAVALHAAETVHLPIFTAGPHCKDTTSSGELQYLWNSALLSSTATVTPVSETSDVSQDLAPFPLDVRQLRERLTNTRLTLLTQFIADCVSSPSPYNALPTLLHLGSASPPTDIPPAPDLQAQFAQQLWTFVGVANEPLLQTVLMCPLVSGLQWLDNGSAARAMRRAMDKAWLSGMQLPIVRDTLERLPLVEEGDDTSGQPEAVEIVDDGADIQYAVEVREDGGEKRPTPIKVVDL